MKLNYIEAQKNNILEKLYELGFDIKKHKEYKSILDYDEEGLELFKKCIYYSYFIIFHIPF